MIVVLGLKLADDSLRVFLLVAHQAEDARVHGQRHEVRVLQPLLEPHELLDELEVWVRASSPVLDSLVALVIRDALREDHICDANCGRAGDSLHAVHVEFSTLTAAVGHELDSVVEATRYVLACVVLQVVALVDHALVLVVVFAIVCGAVNHVRNADILEDFRVFGDEIAAKVQEVVNYFRADSLVKLIFVLLARSAPIVKIFVVQLLRSDLVLLHPVGAGLTGPSMHVAVSVALTLPLTARCPEFMLLVPLAAPTHLMIRRLRGPSIARTADIIAIVVDHVGRDSLVLREIEAAHVLACRLPRMALLLLRHRQVLLLQLLRLAQVEEAELGLGSAPRGSTSCY